MKTPRMAMIGKIHIAKKKLGLDDHGYHAVLRRVVGKSSCSDCTDAELGKIMEEFYRLGFEAPRPKRQGPTGPNAGLAGKLYALWFVLWHLGEAEEPNDQRLLAFIYRQSASSPSALRFATAAQLSTAIEGVKGWLTRLGFAPVSWEAKDVNSELITALWSRYTSATRTIPFQDDRHRENALHLFLGRHVTFTGMSTPIVSLSDSEVEDTILLLAKRLREAHKAAGKRPPQGVSAS